MERIWTRQNIEMLRNLLESGEIAEMVKDETRGPHFAIGYLKGAIQQVVSEYDSETKRLGV